MPRPRKMGIDYFPFDVGFFQDDKITGIERVCGPSCVNVIVALYSEIYRVKGYYLEWNDQSAYNITKVAFFGRGDQKLIVQVQQAVKTAVQVGLFNRELFESDSVLTSVAIQSRLATIASRRKNLPFSKYLLINVDINPVSDDINEQSKVKESKTTTTYEDIKETLMKVPSFVDSIREDEDLLNEYTAYANCKEKSALSMIDEFLRLERGKPTKEKEFWKWKKDLEEWTIKPKTGGIDWLRRTGRLERETKSSSKPSIQQSAEIVESKEVASSTDKVAFSEFVFLYPHEYDKLVNEYGKEQTDWMIDKMNNRKGAHGLINHSDYYALKDLSAEWLDLFNRRKKKEKAVIKKEEINLDFISNSSIRPIFERWIAYKQEIKDPFKAQSSVEEAYKRLLTYSCEDPMEAERIISKSIQYQWKGFFPNKETKEKDGNKIQFDGGVSEITPNKKTRKSTI